MKKTIFPLLIICIIATLASIGLPSCRKGDNVQPNIKQYDSIQIVNYIAANHLTGFKRDTTGGDTSGIYYKILVPGTGTPLQYSDSIRFVYTRRSFDGLYVQDDTIQEHYSDYVGHITLHQISGLQIAVHNLLMYPNASMRVLIPSHLAYGVNGTGSGSSKVANNRIAGNQCLDYYVHAITNFGPYDDLVIRNYMRDSSLTGYTETPDSIYFKILTAPPSTTDPITQASAITCTYTGQLLDGYIFDGDHNGTNTATFAMVSFATPGNVQVLEGYAFAGTKISIILPSKQGYGVLPGAVPAFSCMRFTWQVITVTP